MTSNTKGRHEEHVKSLLRAAGMMNYYEDVAKIISRYISKNPTNPTFNAGKFVYRFDIEDLIYAKVVSRVFKGKYDISLKNSVQFIPIYSPSLDRTVTLKYWGEHKDMYSELKNVVLEFNNDLKCMPSGICEYSTPLRIHSDELERAMGLYWLFSLHLPYNYRNPLIGNTYVVVDDNELYLFKIFHTVAVNENFGVNLSDIYFKLSDIPSNCKIEDNYLTYLLIHTLKIGNDGKLQQGQECIPYSKSTGRFDESDLIFRVAFLVLRTMYRRRNVQQTYPDILYVGSVSEFKRLFTQVLKTVRTRSGFNIGSEFDQRVHRLFIDSELEFKNGYQAIRMFVLDKSDGIVFVHPYLTTLFLTDKGKADIINDVVNTFTDPSARKDLLSELLGLANKGSAISIFDVRNRLKRRLPSLDQDSDIPFLVQTFKKVYESVVLNKADVAEQSQ